MVGLLATTTTSLLCVDGLAVSAGVNNSLKVLQRTEMALVTEKQDAAAAGDGASVERGSAAFDAFNGEGDYQQVYKNTILLLHQDEKIGWPMQ